MSCIKEIGNLQQPNLEPMTKHTEPLGTKLAEVLTWGRGDTEQVVKVGGNKDQLGLQ